jgi:hypothetical protein
VSKIINPSQTPAISLNADQVVLQNNSFRLNVIQAQLCSGLGFAPRATRNKQEKKTFPFNANRKSKLIADDVNSTIGH